MKRLSLASLVVPMLLAIPGGTREPTALCDGRPRAAPLGPTEFRGVLDSVAAGWNGGRPETAVLCFTETATYLEPPDRQRYQGRVALREFFAASVRPPRPDRMRWHDVAFDSTRQVGFGEYTYRSRQNYHGIVVVQLDRGLIRSWREYQYRSPLHWEEFVGPSR
jgi:SnoaL-like domain